MKQLCLQRWHGAVSASQVLVRVSTSPPRSRSWILYVLPVLCVPIVSLRTHNGAPRRRTARDLLRRNVLLRASTRIASLFYEQRSLEAAVVIVMVVVSVVGRRSWISRPGIFFYHRSLVHRTCVSSGANRRRQVVTGKRRRWSETYWSDRKNIYWIFVDIARNLVLSRVPQFTLNAKFLSM